MNAQVKNPQNPDLFNGNYSTYLYFSCGLLFYNNVDKYIGSIDINDQILIMIGNKR
jgi:hypothetical protein